MSRCVQKGRRDVVGIECQAKNTGEKTAKKESNCVSMDFIPFICMHMYEMAPFPSIGKASLVLTQQYLQTSTQRKPRAQTVQRTSRCLFRTSYHVLMSM